MTSTQSTTDKIKLCVAAIGTMVGGVVIVSGPGTLPQEIPFHLPLGLGVIIFGVLMLLALFSVRAKSLLVGTAVGLFSTGGLLTALLGDLNVLHAAVIGIVSALAGLYALQCFISVFTGDDPT